jgi:UDP-N-acetylmuramoyl-tripeptide--D-alanyl-D-alanine ligase
VLYDGSGTSADALMPDDTTPPPLVWASDVSLDGEGRPTFTLNAVGFGQLGLEEAHGSRTLTLELRGLHNVSNACAAAAIGLASGMSIESCCRALEAARPEKGRQVIHRTEGAITVVDDAYNANPDSMAASLATFAALDVPGKRIAVLGDMLELGDYARKSHEKVGMQAAASKLDELICVGELAQHIAAGARQAGMDEHSIVLCANAAEALEALQGTLRAGDAVLVKASHSIGLEHVVEGLVI